jgi:hypothetical protein
MALMNIPIAVMMLTIAPIPSSAIELSTPNRTNIVARLLSVNDNFSGLAELVDIHVNIAEVFIGVLYRKVPHSGGLWKELCISFSGVA